MDRLSVYFTLSILDKKKPNSKRVGFDFNSVRDRIISLRKITLQPFGVAAIILIKSPSPLAVRALFLF